MPRRKKTAIPHIGNPLESWLFKAKNDLRAAKTFLKHDQLTLDAAIYHTQQCAEKIFNFVQKKINFTQNPTIPIFE